MTDLEKIKEANRERNTEIVLAARECDAVEPGEDAPHKRIAAALFVVAGQFRARGEALKAAKRKGHVSTKAALDFAAEQVEDVAGSLTGDGWEWTRAASEVAGVAVSLERDGMTTENIVYMNSTGPIVTDKGAFSMKWPAEQDSPVADDRRWPSDAEIAANYKALNQAGNPDDLGPMTCSADSCVLPREHTGAHYAARSGTADDSHGFAESGTSGVCYCGESQAHPVHNEPTLAESAPVYAGQCSRAGFIGTELCMLPSGHTGVHIGTKGSHWPQTEIEQTERIRQDATAIVAELKGDEPIGTKVTVGGVDFVKIGNDPFGETSGIRTLDEVRLESVSVGAWGPDHPVRASDGAFFVEGTIPASEGAPLGAGVLGGVSIAAVNAELNSHHIIPIVAPEDTMRQLITLGGPVSAPVVPIAPAYIPAGYGGAGPKPYQSVSSIETMADCGLKYRMNYRDQIPETPAWWNVGGRAMHQVAEDIERMLFGLPVAFVSPALDELAKTAGQRFADAFAREVNALPPGAILRAANKGTEHGAWWERNGPDMAARYLANRAQIAQTHDLAVIPTSGAPLLETRFDVDFDGIPVIGYIDQAFRERTSGQITVRDLKFGSRTPSQSFQLGVYGHALRALGVVGPSVPVLGTYYMGRKGEDKPRPVPVTQEWSREAIAYRAQTTAAADAAGLFLARPSEYCGSCAFRARCPVMNGGESS